MVYVNGSGELIFLLVDQALILVAVSIQGTSDNYLFIILIDIYVYSKLVQEQNDLPIEIAFDAVNLVLVMVEANSCLEKSMDFSTYLDVSAFYNGTSTSVEDIKKTFEDHKNIIIMASTNFFDFVYNKGIFLDLKLIRNNKRKVAAPNVIDVDDVYN